MKKLMLVFAAIAITAGAYAQTDATKRQMSPQDKSSTQKQNMQNDRKDLNNNQRQNTQTNRQDLNTQRQNNQNNQQDMNNNQNQNMQNTAVYNKHPDGVMMQNGKIMQVKNGQMTILQDQDMTLSNGTKIMSDGTYTKKDGTKMTMKEGQHMDMSGNMTSIKTDKTKNTDNASKSPRK